MLEKEPSQILDLAERFLNFAVAATWKTTISNFFICTYAENK